MKNNTLFKVLFAIEMALLPLTIFAYLFLPHWAVGLFVAGVLLCKIWREIFKDKFNKTEIIINSVASVITNTTLLAMFMVAGVVSKPVGIIAVIAIALKVCGEVFMFNKELPEFIDAVSYCFILFECAVLIGMTFAFAYSVVLSVACIACIMTGALYFGYAVYDFIRNLPKKSK